MSSYIGIDYGMGMSNIDHRTGIRFGVIPAHALSEAWYSEAETDYGPATCPVCGNDAVEYDEDAHGEYPGYRGDVRGQCPDYVCEDCGHYLDYRDCWSEDDSGVRYVIEPEGCEPAARTFFAHSDSTGDVWVELSPFYTLAAYCSPCAPGACWLLTDTPDGERAYCFGHEWFEGGRAPYPVYSVATGELIQPE